MKPRILHGLGVILVLLGIAVLLGLALLLNGCAGLSDPDNPKVTKLGQLAIGRWVDSTNDTKVLRPMAISNWSVYTDRAGRLYAVPDAAKPTPAPAEPKEAN